MKYFQEDNQLLIMSWCNSVDEKTLEQARNMARLPFAFHHVCLMPDTHMGYGMPIGGVLATIGAVVPNAVGVDIGCGMCFCQTNLKVQEVKGDIPLFIERIKRRVPVGFAHLQEKVSNVLMPNAEIGSTVLLQEYESARTQLGTLGGGNHFIELQADEEDFLCFMIHSGSRNFGYKLANYYNKQAIEINEKYFSSVPKEWQLAFLPTDSDEAQSYLSDMVYCCAFAQANRRAIAHTVKDLDESASAYKDIDVVMEEQKDLVQIVKKLRPLAVVKG